MKKGSKVYIIITILFFLAMVLYAAYASLTINAEVTTNNLNITSNTYSPMVFTSVGGNSLTVNISAENMDSSNAGNFIATMSDNLTVRLDTDGKDAMCCTYNVSWEWVEDNNTLNQYTKSNTESNEFTLTGTTSGTAGTYNFTNQLPNYNASSRTTSMLSGAQICNKNSGVTAATVSQVWTFTTNFYNLNVNQDAFKGASLNGKVKITDVSCNKGESINFNIGGTSYKATQNMTWQEWVNSSNNTAGYQIIGNRIYNADSSKIIDVSLDAVITSSNNYQLSNPPENLSSKIVVGNSGTGQVVNEGNGLRYEGQNPNNYVCFSPSCTNDTIYRIIGKFTELVDTNNDGVADTNQSVIKIIKNTSIGNMPWDYDYSDYAYLDNSSKSKIKLVNNKFDGAIAAQDGAEGQNDWSQASLKNYLNNYWTKPTNNMLTTRWHLKSPTGDITTSECLNLERNGNVFMTNPAYVDAKVGLMYPSDYGYAVLASSCSRTKKFSTYSNSASTSEYSQSGCYDQDWLNLSSDEWTISPANIEYWTVISKFANSGIIHHNNVSCDSYKAIRPSFYISSLTEVGVGDGSYGYPYILDTSANIIDFTIGGTTYHALSGMTWNEWISTTYNSAGFKVKDNKVYTADEVQYINTGPTSTIVADASYTLLTPVVPAITNINNEDRGENVYIGISKNGITLNTGTVSKFYVSSDNKQTYTEVTNVYYICYGDNQNHDLYVHVLTTGGYTTADYKMTEYSNSCFTGDTKIKSENGYTNIENIKIGDKVYSYNEQTQKVELKEVTKTLIHDDNRIYEIRVGNKIIKVTPDHRIYVKAKYGNKYNWTKVYNIHEGDYLLDSNNKEVRIDSIKYYESKDDIKVYNIEVKDNHTYYVSDGNYLVHNAKSGSCDNPGVPEVT